MGDDGQCLWNGVGVEGYSALDTAERGGYESGKGWGVGFV